MNRIGKVTKIEIIRQFIYRKIKLVSVLEYNVGNFVVVTVQLHAKSGAALFFQRRNKTFQYGRIMKRNIPGVNDKFPSMKPVQDFRCIDYAERSNLPVCPTEAGNTSDLLKV